MAVVKSYTPKGTYNDKDLPDYAKKEIEIYQSQYDDAIARGDRAAADEAHKGAEGVRARYDYSGGVDGSDYIQLATNNNPTFEYDESKPTYKNKYDPQIDEILNQILNRDNFSYNAEDDPLYQQYKQMYQREGDRAMRDTMAEAAAGAGGMNTYAITAAQQAYNNYNAQLNDKIPELYQLAYSMYLDDIDGKVRDLGLLEDMDATQYNRYRDTMADWKDDRNFAYGVYRDDVGDSQWQTSFDYNAYTDTRDYTTNREDTNYNRTQYDQEKAYDKMMVFVDLGEMPSDELIAQAGWEKADVEKLVAKVKEEKTQKNNSSTQRVVYTPAEPKGPEEEGDGEGNQQEDLSDASAYDDKSWIRGLNDLGLAVWAYDSDIIGELANAGAIYEENGKLKWADGWNALNFRQKLSGSPFIQPNYNF